MRTLTITAQIGRSIELLKEGFWIARVKGGSRWSYNTFFWFCSDENVDPTPEFQENVEQLKKLKLVTDRAFSPYGDRNLRHFRNTRRIYEATEYAKTFPLPPAEFWVRE